MARSIVCISHATGAGGNEVGRLVAEQLGFRHVDEELVSDAAEVAGVEPSQIADEERRKSWLERMVAELAAGGGRSGKMALEPHPQRTATAASIKLREYIREAIEETADDGKVVIVAHAASHALAGRNDVLRVLVTGTPAARAAHLAESEKLSAPEAERAIKQADDARADYLKRFHQIGEELPTQYDLVLNTDRLSTDEAAELIREAAST
jgi:cytidylate kinase